MLEKLLSLPGFIYEADESYYYLGKWICKECTNVDETDCVTMYQMCRSSGEMKEASFYFQKIRAYSDFALEIPYNPALIRENMEKLLASLSENGQKNLEKQIQQVESDV